MYKIGEADYKVKALKKRNIKKIIEYTFILGILLVVVPIVIGSGYTYLCEDDFSFEGGANDMYIKYGSSIIGVAVRTWEYYTTNQGTFLFTFLVHFIRAYSRFGLPGFHVYMVFNTVLFIASLYLLISKLVRNRLASVVISFSSFLLIFAMPQTLSGKELFFWYTGTLNFTLELSFSFMGLSLLLDYMQYSKKKYLILSMIFAFLASGGSLNIASPNCAWFAAVYVICVLDVRQNIKMNEDGNGSKEKVPMCVLLPFAFALTGALINVIAPGNYVRAAEAASEGHETLTDAIRDTFSMCFQVDKILFASVTFICALILVFVTCLVLDVKIAKSRVATVMMIVTLVGTCAIRYFTMFPVSYGYHVDHLTNMRTSFSYQIVAKLMYILFVMFMAQWARGIIVNTKVFKKITVFKSRKLLVITCGIVCVMLFTVVIKWIIPEVKSGYSMTIVRDFKSGAMQETYAAREYALGFFELSESGTDAILYVPKYNSAESMYGMGIGVDCEWFVNKSAANLFDLHTTTIIYSE